MPFSSPLSEHVHVVPANATCNGHRAVVDAKRPRVAPCTSGTLQSFLFSPVACHHQLLSLCPIPIHGRPFGPAHTQQEPFRHCKARRAVCLEKAACFCRGGLDCRRPPSHIKIIEHAATFQPPLLPKRSVASASSAFDQQAIHGCWQCGPKVKKTGHANL